MMFLILCESQFLTSLLWVHNVAVISGTTKDFPQKFQIIITIRGVDKSAHPIFQTSSQLGGGSLPQTTSCGKYRGTGFPCNHPTNITPFPFFLMLHHPASHPVTLCLVLVHLGIFCFSIIPKFYKNSLMRCAAGQKLF